MAQTQSIGANPRERAIGWIRRNGIRIQIFVIFFALTLATWGVVFFSLYLAKKAFRDTYYTGLVQRLDVVENILTTTAGETALQNSPTTNRPAFSPYVLNVSAVDVENPRKAIDIAAQSGCLVTFESHAELCAALGNQAAVGAYLYIVGWIDGLDIVDHSPGTPIDSAHHIDLQTSIRGHDHRWFVVFQASPRALRAGSTASKADLYATGYGIDSTGALTNEGRDEKEFKGRLNYLPSNSDCSTPPCARRLQFAFRVPVEDFRADSLNTDGSWPPPDFKNLRVQLKLFAPATDGIQGGPLIDTTSSTAKHKYSLDAEIGPRFNPLEKLMIFKAGGEGNLLWESAADDADATAPVSNLGRLALSLIPGKFEPDSQGYRRTIKGKLGSYLLVVQSSEALADTFVGPLASQLIPALAGTLTVIFLAWLVVEWRVVRRIRLLTVRADALGDKLKNEGDQVRSDFGKLQSGDELGILARAIHELLTRVNDEVRDKRARLESLQSLWVAIGHDIMSPLQSLSSLHPEDSENDKSRPYIMQMESVIRTLSSAASLEDVNWVASLESVDIDDYLRELCANASLAKLPDLEYQYSGGPVFVKADPMFFDRAMHHVLDNSKRFTPPNSKVKLDLEMDSTETVLIRISNEGPHIPDDLITRIFEIGVSEKREEKDLFTLHAGQGLYIARQLMTSMSGSISVANCQHKGVEFLVRLPRMPPEAR